MADDRENLESKNVPDCQRGPEHSLKDRSLDGIEARVRSLESLVYGLIEERQEERDKAEMAKAYRDSLAKSMKDGYWR